ncbi:hypothetical protein TNCV_3690891 [Trichonephila clavipes]|nr:hypothetical protein TNCV_3690891 [Trichonephila clavipes]
MENNGEQLGNWRQANPKQRQPDAFCVPKCGFQIAESLLGDQNMARQPRMGLGLLKKPFLGQPSPIPSSQN